MRKLTDSVAAVTSMTAGSQESQRNRLAWLDALRGLAVLFVVYEHVSPYLMTSAHNVTIQWFPSGRVGVLLFFLVSGYIIPASLEKRGDVRAFLISRCFRLYPLYAAALAATWLLSLYTPMTMDPGVRTDVVATTASHLTMLSTMVNVPMVLAVTWTLAFEMMFYLLVVSLYTIRLLRFSASIAMGLSITALLAGPLPILLISQHLNNARLLSVSALVVIVFGLAAVLSRLRWLALAGAVVLITLVLSLLLFNEQYVHILDGLSLMAFMFAGSTVYRYHHSQIPGWRALLTLLVVGFGEIITLHEVSPLYTWKYPVGEVVLVYSIFTIVMLWGRRYRTPQVLAWVGGISYSVYLLHDIVIITVGPTIGRLAVKDPWYLQLPVALTLLLAILGLAALTYRFIEVPAQRLGSQLNRRLSGTKPTPVAPAGTATEPHEQDAPVPEQVPESAAMAR